MNPHLGKVQFGDRDVANGKALAVVRLVRHVVEPEQHVGGPGERRHVDLLVHPLVSARPRPADAEVVPRGAVGNGRSRTEKRGIRIGRISDGKVIALIPDPVEVATNTSAAEGVAADADGNVYGAEVGPKALKRYVKE